MRKRPATLRRVVAAALAAVLVSACAAESGTATGDRTLTVLAAASLTETFTELAETFEREHPGVTVRLAFDSSATHARQVVEGAPGDVLATADVRTMATVTDADATAGAPEVFATNRLVLVTSPTAGGAGAIGSLSDLDNGDVDFVVCVESAPCGALAVDVLADAGVEEAPSSEEVDVKAVLAKVRLGEADAGLVYATDARAAGADVRAIELDESTPPTDYALAALAEAAHPDLAASWVDLVLSPRGRQVLARAGFGTP